jgi:hypothetical protein
MFFPAVRAATGGVSTLAAGADERSGDENSALSQFSDLGLDTLSQHFCRHPRFHAQFLLANFWKTNMRILISIHTDQILSSEFHCEKDFFLENQREGAVNSKISAKKV